MLFITSYFYLTNLFQHISTVDKNNNKAIGEEKSRNWHGVWLKFLEANKQNEVTYKIC